MIIRGKPIRLFVYCLICLAIFFLITSGVSLAATAPATAWEKNYGSVADIKDQGYSVWQTSDNGFIIAGTTYSKGTNSGITRVMLVNTDWQGNVLWTKYDDSGANARFVRQTEDGGYIVVGSALGNLFVLKTDRNGEKVWDKVYPRPGGNTVLGECIWQTPDGGYIVSGTANRGGTYGQDMYAARIDGTGNMLWENFYYPTGLDKTNGDEYGHSVWPTSDGGYIIGGSSWTSVNWPKPALLKLDANGNEQWLKVLKEIDGRFDSNYGQVQQTRDGGYIWAGVSGGKMHIIKTDSNGNHQWNSTFNNYGISYSIQQTWDDGYVLTGGPTGTEDVIVIRTDAAGKLLWQKNLKGLGFGKGTSVLQIGNGSYAVAGYTLTTGKGATDDFYLAEIEKDFTPMPNAQFTSPRDAFVMDAGKLYYLTIVMTNNGTMPWTFQDGTILAPSSDSEDMQYFSVINYTIPIGTVVRPGQSIKVNFTYTAPAMNGTYNPEVRMFWNNHGFFGEPARFTFYVVNGTPDTRATATAKPAPTVTGTTEKPTSKPTTATDAATTTGQPEPTAAQKKQGLPCLPSIILPLLVVGTVTVGLYKHRNKE